MSVYSEHDVKSKAVNIFIGVIAANNSAYSTRLVKHREGVYSTVLANIQKYGIQDYARKILKRNSPERIELDEALDFEEAQWLRLTTN